MKNSILISLLFICFASTLVAQENNYQPASDCSNYNAFAKSSQIEQVKPLVSGVRENGTLLLDPEKSDSMESIFQKMGVTAGTTFQLVKETKSRLDSTKFFRKYQQYYYGVEVDGGGYTTAYIGPGGPTDPCAEAYMMAPHILTEISLNHNPTLPSTSVPAILQVQNVESSKLLITHNLTNQCEYRLVWRVAYHKDYSKISWVDAHSGAVIRTIDSRAGHNAPTITYGQQFLNDRTVGVTTTLETPDGSVILYDFDNDCPGNITPANWPATAVPSTNNANEWTNESTQGAYQTFWTTSQIVPLYEGIGIDFGTVNVGSCDEEGAFCLNGSNTTAAFITVGTLNNRPLGLFDVVAHELGHAFMFEFIQYNNLGNRTLHEAMGDILGTYIESIVPNNNGIDWVMGDDEPQVANDPRIDRNLQNPRFNCFQNVVNHNIQHERGLPLGHWYFLVSQGDATRGIPALGTLPALNILIEALNLIEDNSDIPDLMEATMTVVEEQFGRCSNEFLAAARAWEAICVPTGFAVNGVVPSCNFTLSGPNQVCEESNYAQFCAQGGLPNYHFRFRIIGKKSTEYESTCGMIGNTQDGCNCLTLVDFPKYPYYPQYITIELYSPTAGSQFTQRQRVKLVDCDGDDPTCEEYNDLQNEGSENRYSNKNSQTKEADYVKVRAFDLMGRQLFEKDTDRLIGNEIQYHGIIVLVFYDKNGEIVKVSKAFLMD
jgi:Zn-dependent metalloprotease